MKQILVIDNNIDPPHGCADIVRSVQIGMDGEHSFAVVVRRGPEQKYSTDIAKLAGVVISGSKTRVLENAPWIDAQMDFVRKLRVERIPALGLCYGEQIIAKTFGGDSHVRSAPTCEFGFVKITCTPAARDSRLLRGMPQDFYSFCYHYDEVQKLPKDFILTASSESCEIHAFDLVDAPMWGVQFHPERNLEEAKRSMEKIRKLDPNVPLLGKEEADRLFDPNVVKIIFRNFIQEARAYS